MKQPGNALRVPRSKSVKIASRRAGWGLNETGSDRVAHVQLAQAIIRIRDMRDRILGRDHFADPAWDLLLDLYVAHGLKRNLTVSDALAGTHVPPTTATRWLNALVKSGEIERVADTADRRRTFIRLTKTQVMLMDRFFSSLASAGEAGGRLFNTGTGIADQLSAWRMQK